MPIVLKRKIVENVLPKNSFIAVDDFSNAKNLANYLTRLANNDEKYLKYFQWRSMDYWWLNGEDQSYCSMCRKLNNRKQIRKIYKKMSSWWSNGRCENNINYT